MSASTKPAFPFTETIERRQRGGIITREELKHPGMTLRQWYAGKALAICDQNMTRRGINMNYENIAEAAFEIADAMIAEGEK